MIAPGVVGRFNRKTVPEPNTGCLLWTAGATTKGYGQLKVAGVMLRAHRVAWEIALGAIPDGLHVLHRCDTPCCVNVDHLFLGSNADNVRDSLEKGRRKSPNADARKAMTHCKRGHAFTEENTHVATIKHRWKVRECRACLRQKGRDRNATRREARTHNHETDSGQ